MATRVVEITAVAVGIAGSRPAVVVVVVAMVEEVEATTTAAAVVVVDVVVVGVIRGRRVPGIDPRNSTET